MENLSLAEAPLTSVFWFLAHSNLLLVKVPMQIYEGERCTDLCRTLSEPSLLIFKPSGCHSSRSPVAAFVVAVFSFV